MQAHYQTLETLYRIVKNEPNPQTYSCIPRELIVRQAQAWDLTESDLELLAEEGLVTVKTVGTQLICITMEGIRKVQNMTLLRAKIA